MTLLIAFLAGFVVHWLLESADKNSQAKKLETTRQEAMDELRNYQKQIQVDLHNAQEEFAKMNMTKLLYKVLQDVLKEQHERK